MGKMSFKIDNLHGSDDYAALRGDVRIFLPPNDPGLLDLKPEPTSSSASARALWRKAQAKAKSTIS